MTAILDSTTGLGFAALPLAGDGDRDRIRDPAKIGGAFALGTGALRAGLCGACGHDSRARADFLHGAGRGAADYLVVRFGIGMAAAPAWRGGPVAVRRTRLFPSPAWRLAIHGPFAIDGTPSAGRVAADRGTNRGMCWRRSARAIADFVDGGCSHRDRMAAAGDPGARRVFHRGCRWNTSRLCWPTKSRTSAGSTTWRASCKASPRRCCSTIPLSGGSRNRSGPSVNTAAMTSRLPSAATCSLMPVRWRNWNRDSLHS